MGAASWAIPVGVLSAIVIIGFGFFWWWFPRAWKHGVKQDNKQVNELTSGDREAQRQANRAIIERFARARAIERGEIPADEAAPPAYDSKGTTGNVVEMESQTSPEVQHR